MIKFFRKTRYDLMEKNKTAKYLKYAIGEIVLVMIGILLALQVSNWNQNRQLQKEELNILKGLHQEFSENQIRFDTIYKLQEARRDAIITTMTANISEYSAEIWDSIHGNVIRAWTFDPLKGFYNSVINSGKLDLISNDRLKTRISKFQDLVIDYNGDELNSNAFAMNNMHSIIINQMPARFKVWMGIRARTENEKLKHKQAYLNLYKDNTYENMLIFLIAYMSSIFEEGPILREEMISIISLLESEIETHK